MCVHACVCVCPHMCIQVHTERGERVRQRKKRERIKRLEVSDEKQQFTIGGKWDVRRLKEQIKQHLLLALLSLGKPEQWEVEGKRDNKGSTAAVGVMSEGQAWFIAVGRTHLKEDKTGTRPSPLDKSRGLEMTKSIQIHPRGGGPLGHTKTWHSESMGMVDGS